MCLLFLQASGYFMGDRIYSTYNCENGTDIIFLAYNHKNNIYLAKLFYIIVVGQKHSVI